MFWPESVHPQEDAAKLSGNWSPYGDLPRV
jgi:hypothetical protein